MNSEEIEWLENEIEDLRQRLDSSYKVIWRIYKILESSRNEKR